MVTPFEIAGFAGMGFSAVLVGAILLGQRQRGKRPEPGAPRDFALVSFLFDDAQLVDASDAARRIWPMMEPQSSDLDRVLQYFAGRFAALADLEIQEGESRFSSQEGDAELVIEADAGARVVRISHFDRDTEQPPLVVDNGNARLMQQRVDSLRAVAWSAPIPVWRQRQDGRIIWANEAYRELAEDAGKTVNGDIPDLFRIDTQVPGGTALPESVRLEMPRGNAVRWFELALTPLAYDTLCAAVPIDRAVRAETTRREFVDALTQTFAHLSVGLTIFGRDRKLALFNPALSELLDLPPGYLVSRPTLFQVFDRLREKRLIPEPRDYKAWRQKMSDLEAAAIDGTYSETWSLVDGRTFRVTGRPHPEGAVALVFEDISSEVSLKREFQLERALNKNVLDGLSEAIAVFSPAGQLSMSNRAYAELWELTGEEAAASVNFVEATRRWQQMCLPTPVWGDARDFVASLAIEREGWSGEVRCKSGQWLCCRFENLPGGLTLVGFAERSESQAARSTSIPRLVSV